MSASTLHATESLPQTETEQLKLANHYLRVALDQVSEGVIMMDVGPLDGTGPRVIYSNIPAACTVGVEPGKGLRGLHLADLVTSERDVVALLSALKDAARSGAAECQAQIQTFYSRGSRFCTWRVKALHDNAKRLLSFTITVLPVPNDFAVVPQSVTSSATQALAPRADDLDAQAERLRTENLAALAKGIAHDVNNLLGPIVTQLSLLVPQVEPGNEFSRTLENVLTATRRARQFTAQVVNAAKAKFSVQRPVELQGIITDTITLAQAGANVQVRAKLVPNLHPVMADPVKVTQVLQNLVMNGIQAMPSGGFMDLEAHNVNLRLGDEGNLRPGPYVHLIVRDRGCGISPENLRRLFSESFTTKADGNGIGLTTCKRFIDEHNGAIRVESTVGVGTEFHLFLPIALKESPTAPVGSANEAPVAAAPTRPAVRPASAPLLKGQGRVLLVEDEEAIRLIAKMVLVKCGYTTVECDNGQDAVSLYQQEMRGTNPFDVVMMDLTLKGGMEGDETARAIWKIDPGARIIVSSGSVTEDVQRSFLDQGFAAILPKPYEAQELAHVMNEVLTTADAVA